MATDGRAEEQTGYRELLRDLTGSRPSVNTERCHLPMTTTCPLLSVCVRVLVYMFDRMYAVLLE